ncbi:O-antigen ligase family protein [Geofilum rhodophaeum]|uniref:O-antigen ligase family protein n=1 Tax=Geofilum rhodophaeum TaxID=1965019 RepID=UPI001F0A0B7D|nr:O-antigen ligase family protein [Geofilum rhodophaeum]
MIQLLRTVLLEKQNYLILLFWVALGIFTGPVAYLAVPLHMFLLQRKGEWLWLLLGFWLILTLSDSRQAVFGFAQSLKSVLMLALTFFYITFPQKEEGFSFIKPFIAFFVLAFYSLLENPLMFYGFQKTLSYVLLLLIVPGVVFLLLKYERERFLFHLCLMGAGILALGLVLRFVMPDFVIFKGERFSGMLGNPNGLGIYSFVFLMLFTFVSAFHKKLFTNWQKILVYVLIGLSAVFAGSRGGIFSSLLFILGWFLLRRDAILGFITMAVVFASYQLVMANFVEIVTYLNLEDYFRLETLDTGSGRVVVAEVAWRHIHENYWFSKGFTYNETVLAQYQDYFEQHGHQGNVHNSWLTMWLDTGLVGLVLFSFGWLVNFIKAAKFTPMVWAVMFGLLLSISVESWLTASLNPFTIVLVIILSMLANPYFYPQLYPAADTSPVTQ